MLGSVVWPASQLKDESIWYVGYNGCKQATSTQLGELQTSYIQPTKSNEIPCCQLGRGLRVVAICWDDGLSRFELQGRGVLGLRILGSRAWV